MTKSSVAKRIKSLREDAKLSQYQLAKALSVSQQTVASWEVGRTEPSTQMIEKITDYFHVTVDFLFERNQSTTVDAPGIQSQVLMLQRAAKENGMDDQELQDILSYAKYRYPDRFKGID